MSHERIKIPFGEEIRAFSMPDGVEYFHAEPSGINPSDDPLGEVVKALDDPIGSDRIECMVKPGQRICIISDDNTRPTPVHLILEELLPRLHGAGIRKEDITIIMALGSHRYMTEDEMIRKVGKAVYEKYHVCNSEFRDMEKLVTMGQSNMGTLIKVNREAAEADVRIGLGNIIPHTAMGWSGGAKILYPGVTSEEIVSEFHVHQGLANENLFGLDDCYIRLEVEKWTEMIGLDFIINTVMTPDLRLYKVVAGHYIKAHRAGVLYAKESLGSRLKYRADIAISSSYPMNIDFWQGSKGLFSGTRAIKEGGTVILLAPCYEGIGPHKEVSYYTGLENGEALLLEAKDGKHPDIDLLALSVGVCLGKLMRKYNIVLISDNISDEQAREMNIERFPVSDFNAAIEMVCKKYEKPTVCIITHGGETVPYEG